MIQRQRARRMRGGGSGVKGKHWGERGRTGRNVASESKAEVKFPQLALSRNLPGAQQGAKAGDGPSPCRNALPSHGVSQ